MLAQKKATNKQKNLQKIKQAKKNPPNKIQPPKTHIKMKQTNPNLQPQNQAQNLLFI